MDLLKRFKGKEIERIMQRSGFSLEQRECGNFTIEIKLSYTEAREAIRIRKMIEESTVFEAEIQDEMSIVGRITEFSTPPFAGEEYWFMFIEVLRAKMKNGYIIEFDTRRSQRKYEEEKLWI